MQIRERKDVSVETGVGRGGILRGGRKKKTQQKANICEHQRCVVLVLVIIPGVAFHCVSL